MIIYLRHGHDEGPNQDHRHDHKLTKGYSEDIKRYARMFYMKYGRPKIIRISPFLRARETASIIMEEFRRLDGGKDKTTLIADPKISRYFSSSEQLDPSIYSETREMGVPITESRSAFKQRVGDHIYQMYTEGNLDIEGDIVLVITHTLVLKEVIRQMGSQGNMKMPSYVPFLYSFKCYLPKR